MANRNPRCKRFAEEHALPVRTPRRLRDPAAQAELAAFGAEVGVVAAYGLILPAPILAAPRLGCLNIHASLLPRWRGAAPIQRALLEGDAATGITIMQMTRASTPAPCCSKRRCDRGRRDRRLAPRPSSRRSAAG